MVAAAVPDMVRLGAEVNLEAAVEVAVLAVVEAMAAAVAARKISPEVKTCAGLTGTRCRCNHLTKISTTHILQS